MTDLKYHPVCTAFPEYPPEVYAARLADYRDHPERAGDTAVVLAADDDGDWKIADGRHHYRLCRELGYECEFLRFTGDRAALVALVESRNAHRRHCEPSQIAASLVAIHSWAKGTNQHGRPVGGGWGPGGELGPGDPSSPTQQEVAEKAGIGRETLKRAAKVKEKAPEVLPAVRDGKLDAKTAAKVADLPAEDRAEIVAAEDVKRAAKQKLAGKTPSAGPTDVWGVTIPDALAPVFTAGQAFAPAVAAVKQLRKDLAALAAGPAGRHLQGRLQYKDTGKKADGSRGGRWEHTGLESLLLALEDTAPAHAACVYAYNPAAPHPADCPLCKGQGWTPRLGKTVSPVVVEAARAALGVGEDAGA